MAKLVFFDERHEYQIDGVKVPSVSEILRFISREIYGDVNQFALDNACNRGSNVHKATEILDKYGEVTCTEDIEGYIKAYVSFRRDNSIMSDKFLAIEKSYGSLELGYAGTVDRIVKTENDGEVWLYDLKTSYAAQKKLWSAALNGYKQLVEAISPEIKIIRMSDIHLKSDGTYSIIDINPDPTVFNCCLTIHNFIKSKQRKKTRS